MRPARKTSGLAALLLFAFALVFGATQPAAADPRLQTVSPCSKVTLSLNFNGVTGANCSGGARFQSPTLLPGWTFTRASPETCQWASGLLTTAASGVPCITDLGLAVWESRANALTFSQAFTNAAWVSTRATSTDNVQAAPDGTLTAAKLIEDSTAANNHTLTRLITSGYTTATTYTVSIFARANGRTKLTIVDAVTLLDRSFDLSNGTTAAGQVTGANPTSWTMTPYVNGWYRCSITFTTASVNVDPRVYLSNGTSTTYNGDGVSGVFIWGGQVEAGAFPTPYIPTTTVAVTRAADAPQFSSFTFPATGTVLADYTMPANPSASRAFLYMVLDGGNSRFSARGSDVSGAQPTFVVGDGVANTTLGPNNLATGQAAKTAFSYDTTSARTGAAANGVDSTAATQAVAATLTAAPLYVGQGAGINQLNSYVKRLAVVPNFYSPAQRVAATQ